MIPVAIPLGLSLFLFVVAEVLKADLPFPVNGFVDGINDQQGMLVIALNAVLHGDIPLQLIGFIVAGKGSQFGRQHLAFLFEG